MKKSNILLIVLNILFLIFTITIYLSEANGVFELRKGVYLAVRYPDFIKNLIPLFISTFIVIFSNQNLINTKKNYK